MSKQIAPSELAEIVAGLLAAPEILGELDSPEKHQMFMLDIGRVVADHCGGQVNWLNNTDSYEQYLGTEDTSPLLSVSPNECLPSLNECVWSYHDCQGWEGETVEGVDPGEPVSDIAVDQIRDRLQSVLASAADAMQNSQEPHPPINFNCYGQQGITLSSEELIGDADCVARVECSGSEGYYVEVVKWDDEFGWCRAAFRKFFNEPEAHYWERAINANAPMAKIFHTFPERPVS